MKILARGPNFVEKFPFGRTRPAEFPNESVSKGKEASPATGNVGAALALLGTGSALSTDKA
jgi:hypothetical protein